MSFDLSAAFSADVLAKVPNQVQQYGEGDPNAWNNCIPTAIMVVRAAYGGRVVDPQAETDGAYGRDHIGGEDFWVAENWVEQNVSPAPGTIAGNAGLDALEVAAAQGFAVIGFFHCDVNATINTAGPYYHASVVLSHVNGAWMVLNVHDYSCPVFDEAGMAAVMQDAGGFVCYERALPAATSPEEDFLAALTPDQQQQVYNAVANPAPDASGSIKHGDGGTDQIFNLALTGDRGDGKGSILTQIRDTVAAIKAQQDKDDAVVAQHLAMLQEIAATLTDLDGTQLKAARDRLVAIAAGLDVLLRRSGAPGPQA